MATDELIDGHVSLAQSQKAITALLQYVRKEQERVDEKELLPAKPQHVWLVMTVKRMHPTKNFKPHKIPLAHPLFDPRTSPVCLITKDPQREYKDLLASHDIKFISRVVGVKKLRGKFKGFDARRMLLRENDLFLADERVIPLLPGLLGSKWFDAKKQPIPVSLTKKALKSELEKAISSTYMHQNQGTCTSIKIATISQKDKHVLANLVTALPAIVARIRGGWNNVQSLNIKTSNSVSLPIWTCPLEGDRPGSRWEGMGIDESEWTGFDAGEGDVKDAEDVPEAAKETPKANGKKRAVEATEETHETPKKTKRAQNMEDVSSSSTVTSGPVKKSKSKEPKVARFSPTTKDSDTKGQRAKPTPTTPAKEKSSVRTDLAEKKEALEGAALAKRKGKLREVKSAKRGVKERVVGRIKA